MYAVFWGLKLRLIPFGVRAGLGLRLAGGGIGGLFVTGLKFGWKLTSSSYKAVLALFECWDMLYSVDISKAPFVNMF